jgi:hypothetical protein
VAVVEPADFLVFVQVGLEQPKDLRLPFTG